ACGFGRTYAGDDLVVVTRSRVLPDGSAEPEDGCGPIERKPRVVVVRDRRPQPPLDVVQTGAAHVFDAGHRVPDGVRARTDDGAEQIREAVHRQGIALERGAV